jgi:glycine/D-amino acid oxidase-like deaminating enzyme
LADDLFSPAYAPRSHWRDIPELGDRGEARLPARADVLVIGSGYTGLNAAIETARAGRHTVVIEAGAPGEGCSSRNGGQIGTSVKPSLEELSRRFGLERARAIREAGKEQLEWIEARIAELGISCDFRRAGRFHAAHTPQAYETLAREAERLHREEGIEAHVVPRSEQARELGSALYHGGVVYPRHARVHPGKLLAGYLAAAKATGATVVGHCPARAIARDGAGFAVKTTRGMIAARELVVATNGYSGPLLPWLRRRIIPIGSHVIATEPVPRALMDRLFPTDRVISDSRRVVYYYSASPDRSRVIFGGRVAAGDVGPEVSGPRLRAELARLFPELSQTRIERSWSGLVGYTFDTLMHIGRHEGIWFAAGYCGSGVGMASWLGWKLGLKILGRAEGATAFDDLPFPTRPFYTGRPWFLPAVVAWYRWRDARDIARA